MGYSTDRSEFIARVAVAMAESSPSHAVNVAHKLLRHASTLQRLAVAQCNGDYPADNGRRAVIACPLCESGWVPSAIVGGPLARAAWDARRPDRLGDPIGYRACPDCRISAAIRAIVREHLPMYQPVFSGDPRGYVVKLAPVQASRADIDSGRAPTIAIPGRE